MTSRDVEGKTFIVTGAGGGIGGAVCTLLSSLGAQIAAVDLKQDAAERIVAGLPGDAISIAADVTTVEGTDAYLTRTVEAFGRIDGAHLNAGVLGPLKPLADTEPDAYEWEMGVNARGVYLGLRGVIRRLREQGAGGSIVVTASTAGLQGSQSLGIYAASKHAAIGLVRSAALDHITDGIRINAICPGEVDTPMLQQLVDEISTGRDDVPNVRADVAAKVPIGRFAEPSEEAAAAVWLLSSDSSYVTGAALVVDGGLIAGKYTRR